jgi:hypothetical protein
VARETEHRQFTYPELEELRADLGKLRQWNRPGRRARLLWRGPAGNSGRGTRSLRTRDRRVPRGRRGPGAHRNVKWIMWRWDASSATPTYPPVALAARTPLASMR